MNDAPASSDDRWMRTGPAERADANGKGGAHRPARKAQVVRMVREEPVPQLQTQTQPHPEISAPSEAAPFDQPINLAPVADQLTAIAELLRAGRLGALSKIVALPLEVDDEWPGEAKDGAAMGGDPAIALRGSAARRERRVAPVSPDPAAMPAAPGGLLELRRRSAELARQTYVFRRKRASIFGDPDLFGEPAWDILLDLYIAHVDGKPVSVSSACIGSGAPATTGLRWLGILAQRDLIVREQDRDDQRRVLVRLSDRGLDAMDRLLADWLSREQGRTPGS